jgi:hypothetical protein
MGFPFSFTCFFQEILKRFQNFVDFLKCLSKKKKLKYLISRISKNMSRIVIDFSIFLAINKKIYKNVQIVNSPISEIR